MVNDLVSRVLSAIERLERAAEEAKGNPQRPGRWAGGPRRDHPGYEIVDLTSGWVHTQTQQSAQSLHISLNDPESVLRLCQSLRDIVAMCVEVIGDFDLSTYGQFGILRHHRNALAVTLAVETMLNTARGLGIEDTQQEEQT